MRYHFAIAAAALWAGTAFADEPAACYIAKDPTGDLVPEKVKRSEANTGTDAQIIHSMNQSNRDIGKCLQRHTEREKAWSSGTYIQYGMRISPAGKVTQVSVMDVKNNNDAMLMACLGRIICKWELEPDADGQERRVAPPAITMGGLLIR